MPSFNIYCNYHFPDSSSRILREGLMGHKLLLSEKPQASNLVAGPPDPLLQDADIALGQPDPMAMARSPRLRWTHLTSAGYDRYDQPEVRAALQSRGAMLTNASGVYDEPCAQHALAFMMADARQLAPSFDLRLADHSWPAASIRTHCRLLGGQTVLLLGFGAIAQRLVELLAPFRMNILAIRRSPRGDEPIKTFPNEKIDELLPLADHVVSILPGGKATEHFIGAPRFALMKPSAVFYNIGRGSVVDQAALQAALQTGRLGAAYLDVTTPEPLPSSHPLWTTPNCYITPHTAGGHVTEFDRLAEQFVENLRRFEGGQPLRNRVI